MKNTIRVKHLKNSASQFNGFFLKKQALAIILSGLVFTALACSSSSSDGAADKPVHVAGQVIGRSGGSFFVADGSSVTGAEIEIPKESLSADTLFQINESSLPAPLPQGVDKAGPCISFLPHGQVFKRKANLFLPYQDTDNNGVLDSAGSNEKRSSVFYYNPNSGRWEKQNTSYRSLSSNRIGIQTDHLSTFLVAVDQTTPDPETGDEVPALVKGEYFTGPAEYTLKEGVWVIWPKGCIKDESIRCGQSWNLTVTYRNDGLYAVIDRYTTMTGGYKISVADDYKSGVINIFDIPEFEKVKRSGDVALWTWAAKFEKDHTHATKYRVLDDSSVEAANVTGEKIYADVEIVDSKTIKVAWKIKADTDLIPGDILVVIFEAVYNG